MSNVLDIARKLSKLGTDVFEIYSFAESLHPAAESDVNHSELKGYVSEFDDFIGAELEISVNIDEPQPIVIKNEPREETSEKSLKETPEHPCREIPPVTIQNNIPESLAGDAFNKYKSITIKGRVPCMFKDCSKTYVSRSNLMQHVRDWHYKLKNYACKICDKKFARRSTWQKHQNLHTRGNGFRCKICVRLFKCPLSLENHLMTFHRKGGKRCRSFNKKLPNEQELQFHESADEGKGWFKCRICNNSFIFALDLDQHVCPLSDIAVNADCVQPPPLPPPPRPTHEKQIIKKVPCSVCHKKLSKDYIKRHESICRYNERAYVCFICTKRYETMYCLNQHMRYAHYAVKDNVCEWCQKRFARKPCLRRHIQLVHKRESLLSSVNNNNNNSQQG